MAQRLPPEAIDRLEPYLPREDLESFRALTTLPWSRIPPVFRAGAMTFGGRVLFRDGRFRTDTAAGLALIAHETGHIGQWRELGVARFVLRYASGLVRSRFDHDSHPMEAPLEALQDRVREDLRASGLP